MVTDMGIDLRNHAGPPYRNGQRSVPEGAVEAEDDGVDLWAKHDIGLRIFHGSGL